MKKEYSKPTLAAVRLDSSQILAISGGGKGIEGDNNESRQFWGGSPWDDESEENSDGLF